MRKYFDYISIIYLDFITQLFFDNFAFVKAFSHDEILSLLVMILFAWLLIHHGKNRAWV
tara:strand:+ start:841 stop:1017 length:177 start_codon:yes stop_codon:yes gene_type:complete